MKKSTYVLICLMTINLNFSFAQLSLTVFHDSLSSRSNALAPLADELRDIEYHNDFAYFSSYLGTLQRTSLTDPNSVIETLHDGVFNRLSGISISGNDLFILETSDAISPESIGTPNSGKLYKIDLSTDSFTLTELRDSLNFPSEIEIVDNIAYIVENNRDAEGYLINALISMTDIGTMDAPITTIFEGVGPAEISDIEFYSDFIFFNQSNSETFEKRIAKIDLLDSYTVHNQYVHDGSDFNFLKGVIRDGIYYLANTNSFTEPRSIYSLDLSDTLATPTLTVAPPVYPGEPDIIYLGEVFVGPLDNLFTFAILLFSDFSDPEDPTLEAQTVLYKINENFLSVLAKDKGDKGNIFYPNPAKDHITIQNLDSKTNYTIFSITGKICQSGQISSGEKIYLENLEKGQYILRTENSAQSFIKQ